MRLGRRVRVLEGRAAALPAAGGGADARERAFLGLVPEDLRAAVAAALGAAYSARAEALASWALWPFARWAPPPAAGYRLPRALVGWVLAPPRRYWMGHHCGRCGLAVPLYRTWPGDPDPPADLRPFPVCPACGGATGHAAHYGPDPVTA